MFHLLQASPLVLLWLSGFALFGIAADPQIADAPSGAASETIAFDLPETDLETAVRVFSSQCNCQVLWPSTAARGAKSRSVKGNYTPRAALERLLQGSELAVAPGRDAGPFALVAKATASVQQGTINAGAVIVIGTAVDAEQRERFRRHAGAAQKALEARGVPARAIQVVPADAAGVLRRSEILRAIRGLPESLEESWLLLLGNVAPARDGRPALQVNGPRFTADDLREAAGAMPGKIYVIVGTSRAAGFLPGLQSLPDVEAVAATAERGEVNEPRFVAHWAAALQAKPSGTFHEIADEACRDIERYYRDNGIAQTEHAYRLDRATSTLSRVAPAAESTPVSR